MTGLEQAFYILGIVFMGLILLLTLALLAAVIVIRKKITNIHDNIEQKLHSLTSLAERGGELSALTGSQVFKQAKKALNKAKK